MTDKRIAPCLWFNTEAEEAANFYVSVFPDSRIDLVMRSPVDWPAGKAGAVILVEFVLAGSRYQALNGGPHDSGAFNDSVSLSVSCKDQAEVDRYWEALTADGGEPVMCGWLKDRYGLRWQIVPQQYFDMMKSGTAAQTKRVMEAMMQQVKMDVAALEQAFNDADQ